MPGGPPVPFPPAGLAKIQEGAGVCLSVKQSQDGVGRLEGILMRDYQLSRPFELGTGGTFRFSANGDLYLRCRDAWNELADNSGRVSVKLKVQGRGTPLAKPKSEKED